MIKAFDRAEHAFNCFVEEIRKLESEMDNFDDDYKQTIEHIIKNSNELAEDWRIFYGEFLEDLSANDELYDENGELKPEYYN